MISPLVPPSPPVLYPIAYVVVGMLTDKVKLTGCTGFGKGNTTVNSGISPRIKCSYGVRAYRCR